MVNVSVYRCRHSFDTAFHFHHLNAFMRKSAFVCIGGFCEYFCHLGPMSEHTTLFLPSSVFTSMLWKSHVCLLCVCLHLLCLCIRQKYSRSWVEILGRIVSRVLLMIITVESMSQGTAGQLPACLPALLPSRHSPLTASLLTARNIL